MKRMMLDQAGDGLHPEAPGCCPQEPVCRPTGEWILSKADMKNLYEDAQSGADYAQVGVGATFEEWAKENGVV